MKIFFNSRIVEFVTEQPQTTLPSDMIHFYRSLDNLQEAWFDFERYEKFKKFIVVDQSNDFASIDSGNHGPLISFPELLPSFRDFISMFKYIPAAGGLVKNEKGEFLFIHRLGFWDLPKGKIDKKDLREPLSSIGDNPSARNAAIREVKEETGLK
ncbi:MAG: NUDIX domain-containing protein, partial [Mariniphaga sp.]